ncbi:hypothetical protein QJQ45_028262 [Haematococcus lacustris]|nr:hypothetical protein QJQ45_028262 [Haematococcus lacustris]
MDNGNANICDEQCFFGHKMPEARCPGRAAVCPASQPSAQPGHDHGPLVCRWRFSLYSQLEVITARMLGVHVPPSSATVVQLHGSTRALFYYPKNTKQVIAVAPDLTPGKLAIDWAAIEVSTPQGQGQAANHPLVLAMVPLLLLLLLLPLLTRCLWGEAGVQALMPCRALKQSPADLGSLATGSVDAVTCLGALASCPEDQQGRVLAEVVRVLKPGAPCVIIEPVREGASPVRWLLSQVQGKALGPGLSTLVAAAAARLEELLGIAGLEVVQVDVALEGADPHAVGLVRRSSAAWQALPGRAAVAAPQAKGFKAGSRK